VEKQKHVAPGCLRARVHLASPAPGIIEQGDAREPTHDVTAPIVATTVDDDDLILGKGSAQVDQQGLEVPEFAPDRDDDRQRGDPRSFHQLASNPASTAEPAGQKRNEDEGHQPGDHQDPPAMLCDRRVDPGEPWVRPHRRLDQPPGKVASGEEGERRAEGGADRHDDRAPARPYRVQSSHVRKRVLTVGVNRVRL
jgi:hypothetical protein